jgi:hypothetical protein
MAQKRRLKHAVLTTNRKKVLKELYKFCTDHGISIMDSVIDFRDDDWQDNLRVTVGVAGVEVECLPRNEPEPEPEPKNPGYMFLVDKFKGEWRDRKEF